MRSRILAVGIDAELLKRLAPLLNPSYFEVDRLPTGESALILCRHVPFDLMILSFPLPDLELRDFLAAIRGSESPCREAQLLVFAGAGRIQELSDLVGKGIDLAVPVDEPLRLMHEVASRLLQVAPRRATRVMVRLEADLRAETTLLLCQSENISATGMLLRTDRLFPVGTRARFELLLPRDPAPVAGQAEVVRHADPQLEKVKGLGVKFLAFEGDSQSRLEEFLGRAGRNGAADA